MANDVSNKILYLLATKKIDFSADTFKLILMASGYVFDRDAHETYALVSASELAAGFGYTTGGVALSGVVVTEDDTNDWLQVAWNNVQFTASGGNIGPTPGAIIFDDTTTSPADAVVGYIDFGGNQTEPDGGVATISNIKFRLRRRA